MLTIFFSRPFFFFPVKSKRKHGQQRWCHLPAAFVCCHYLRFIILLPRFSMPIRARTFLNFPRYSISDHIHAPLQHSNNSRRSLTPVHCPTNPLTAFTLSVSVRSDQMATRALAVMECTSIGSLVFTILLGSLY